MYRSGIRYVYKVPLVFARTRYSFFRGMSTQPHVGVVGAGLSGLRCADILARNGSRVTILEARGRIGGRVHQQEVSGHLVDLGPNWIHGSGENPIVAIAEATGTIAQDPEGENIVISPHGHLIRASMTEKVADFVWMTIAEAFEFSNRHGSSIPPERSLFDFFREKVQQTQFSDAEKELCLGAYNYFVASTYHRILEYIGKAAQTNVDIHFHQPVVSIDAPIRDSDNPQKTHQVTIRTATGAKYNFDEVVVTCPLGWLKRNTTAFHPPLPPRLLEAITNMSYGRLEKVYIRFPRAFWHTPSTECEENTRGPVFAQFLEPSYTTHPDDIEWNQECFSLACLPAPHTQPALLFYTYGPCATHIVTAISSLVPGSPAYKETLLNIFQPFYSRLPGYNSSSVDCHPSDILATAWQADEYAGNGSYCNFQVGSTHANRDIETLRSGAGIGSERGLWFAGEHTAPFVALGTTTGAYWSGERAAGAVCERLGLGRDGIGSERDDSLPSAK
ncbi:hypothetical protein N7512_009503 [Penicillium capsulatum]|nr:hypothetical protein N7512_009503 [Penicillium capsulatum]